MQILEGLMKYEDDQFYMVRNRFLILLMMGAMLRESEAVGLLADDVWEDEVSVDGEKVKVLFIYVQKSKTDQERQGHTVVLAENVVHRALCPVSWFRRYQAKRAPNKQFFFHACDGDKLANTTPGHILKTMLKEMGLDASKYGSHSCRKEGATAAAEKQINKRLLMRHGNWKSSCIYNYISDSMKDTLSVSLAIFRKD